jgi:metal-dependent amidase/aminoacylase/carboxypeptidase family protein
LAAAVFATPVAAAGQGGPAQLFERVSAQLQGNEAGLIAFRRDLHQHPEVSGAEERTARVVAERLRAAGLEVRTGFGGHGVVGVLRGGNAGPLVAFRADMDAVPSNAPDPVDFRSRTPGVRHICGHDIHTTVGVAIAEAMAPFRAELRGSVMFVFQPAEERVAGARAMLDDGVFDGATPAAIYAVHTAPLAVGQLATMPGAMMAWRDQVQVRLTGSGNLDAAADSVRRVIARVGTVAPAQATASVAPGFILAQEGPTRTVDGGRIVGGSISVATEESSAQARRGIVRGVEALSLPGITGAVDYAPRAVPGIANDPAVTAAAAASIRAVLGESSVLDLNVISPAFSEDFGAFQLVVPGAFFYLGVGPIGMPHSPGYVADEASIVVGARAMSAVLLDRLAAGAGPDA